MLTGKKNIWMAGLEPTAPAPKAGMLPLHHIKKIIKFKATIKHDGLRAYANHCEVDLDGT